MMKKHKSNVCFYFTGLEEKGNRMLKSFGILIGGIFVGAVGAEFIRRKCPDALNKLYAKTREAASGAKEAFVNGYSNATQPKRAGA